MPLGKTPILQNDLMAEGDNQKYLLFNDALVNLEDAANRSLSIDLSANNVALTETQTTRFAVIQCSGHSVARTLTIPISVGSPPVTTNRVIAVRNSGTGAVTVTHNNSGTDIVIPVAETALLYCNGTDIISLGGVANAATMPLSDDGVQVIAALLSLNIAGTGYTISDDGNGAATITFNVPTDFTGMGDTPADYTGHANKVLAVKATEDGVEFITNPGMSDAAVKTAYENNPDTNAFTNAEQTKLAGIEPNATADMTGAQIKAAYEAEANTNAFTDAEKAKLAGVEDGKFKGSYLNETALNTAHPTAAVGSYAFVDAGIGTDALLYIWDDDDSNWVVSSSGGGTDTPAEIKTKYESNADTNAFTDAEKAKLSGVESNATADQTGAEIVSAIDTELGQTDWKSGGGGGASYPDFTNNAGKVLAVNGTEDDVEWVEGSHPPIAAGDAGKALVVNDTEDGVEWGESGGTTRTNHVTALETYETMTFENAGISSSAYATKGNVFTMTAPRVAHSVAGNFEGNGQVIKAVVAETTSAQPHTITALVAESAGMTVAEGINTFAFSEVVELEQGKTYAIMFVRTDGTGASPATLQFPSSPAGSGNGFTHAASVRFADNDPQVGDDTFLETNTAVAMRVSFVGQSLLGIAERTAYIIPEASYLTVTSSVMSGSSYAAKGNIVRIDKSRILHRLSAELEGGQTIKPVIARVTAAQPHTIQEVVHDGSPLAISTRGVYSFELGRVALTEGETYSVMFVRTDGTATAVAGVLFPTENAGPDPEGVFAVIGAIRYASSDPQVGEDTYYGTGTAVSMNFHTVDPIMGEVWATNHPARTENTDADYPLTNDDFTGNIFLKRNSASANTVTVPAGLTNFAPLTVIQLGEGPTTFVEGPGVTINSLDGKKTLAGQYASGTLIPDGSDTYILVGALA